MTPPFGWPGPRGCNREDRRISDVNWQLTRAALKAATLWLVTRNDDQFVRDVPDGQTRARALWLARPLAKLAGGR